MTLTIQLLGYRHLWIVKDSPFIIILNHFSRLYWILPISSPIIHPFMETPQRYSFVWYIVLLSCPTVDGCEILHHLGCYHFPGPRLSRLCASAHGGSTAFRNALLACLGKASGGWGGLVKNRCGRVFYSFRFQSFCLNVTMCCVYLSWYIYIYMIIWIYIYM